ncbi:MAG: bifunctional glutamate N-acetyltransferase/amino-acid acetyltransferase ArgJ [Desulfamplus sp.]|nr:bifunctional glutamate N-acetyltransferase/amino-acid acetyltransferase ArgJ [Desulfamplus sp.]
MKGFKFKGIKANIKKDGKKDLGIIFSTRPASVAALFTENKVVAAPVIMGRERIKSGICQAIVVNSGNANCFTGAQGIKDAQETARLAANALNIAEALVMVASTGVIGAPLPMDKFRNAIPELTEDIQIKDNQGKDKQHKEKRGKDKLKKETQGKNIEIEGLEDFAQSILTTDLTMKLVSRKCSIRGEEFSIAGVAKGSGMIKPNMATMLAFICTDLDISSALLKSALKTACDLSFNRISVDGDTSTNDMVLAMANGMSNAVVEESDDALEFQKILNDVMLDLSKMIVRDGEGATKLVKIMINGAASAEDAYKAAEAVSHSNLVKTAIYGEDPNWGRITAAAGRSGAMVDPEKMDLTFGDVALVIQGVWQGVDAEKRAAVIMKNSELDIFLNLNIGNFSDFYYFCDFSENYVKINANYRS